MFPYRYFSGADGRRYCYASQRTLVCPYYPPTGDEEPTAKVAEMVESLNALGLDGLRFLRRAHRSASFAQDGVCSGCGAKMISLGFGAWIEAPWDQIDTSGESMRATRAINERLGSTHGRVPGVFRRFGLKREAIAWAREEAQIDKAAAREEVTSDGGS